MFIKTTGRRVVLCGGGEQAAQKARLMCKTDADIVLAATSLNRELQDLVATGRATHHKAAVTAAVFKDAAMAFIATGCPGADAAYHAVARAAHVPVNVVDQPDLCDITTPSIVDRDPVVIAIGTEGTAPLLARQIKTQMEQALSPKLGDLAAYAGRMRATVAHHVARPARRSFWRWVFAGTPRQLWERGDETEAQRAIDAAVAAGAAPDHTAGRVAFVGAGPGAPDLLTLRAVQRLQEADIIFYDAAHEALLELARRDAERVRLAPLTRRAAWPEEATLGAMREAASSGAQVVRLVVDHASDVQKCQRQADALRVTGVTVEDVPGVLSGPPSPAANTVSSNLSVTA